MSPLSLSSCHQRQSCVNLLPPALFEPSPGLPMLPKPGGAECQRCLGSPGRAAVSPSLTHMKKKSHRTKPGAAAGEQLEEGTHFPG